MALLWEGAVLWLPGLPQTGPSHSWTASPRAAGPVVTRRLSLAWTYPIPAAVNDGPPFEAPNGYAPSALVFEELVDFGPCALIRGGSRLDLSPFPSCLAGVRAALTVLLPTWS